MGYGEAWVQSATFLAAADLSSYQFRAVKISDDNTVNLCGAGEQAIGILLDEPDAAGVECRVGLFGIGMLTFGDTVSAGELLKIDSAGRGVPHTSGASSTFIALEDGVVGEEHAVICAGYAGSGTTSVLEANIGTGAVTVTKIGADAVTGAKIADDSIDSEHIVDGSIDTAHLADSQVTVAKLADDAKPYVVYTFNYDADTIADGDILTGLVPGFHGQIVKFDAFCTDPVTTDSKASDLNLEIGTTNVTGGVVALSGTYALGAIQAGTAITADNVFNTTDTIAIEASSTTAFTEGQFQVVITCQQTDAP